MHMKTKWLKRLTAAVLSIGMAFAPAVAESGLTYADVKAPERSSRIMAASESGVVTPNDPTPSNPSSSNASITVDGSPDVFLESGDTIELKVAVSPSDAVVTWSSSDEGVVAVTGNGKTADVKAVKNGTATVMASLEQYNKSASFNIKVTEKLGLEIRGYSKFTMTMGDKPQAIEVNIISDNGTDTVVWTITEGQEFIRLDKNDTASREMAKYVVPLAPGTAKVTASIKDHPNVTADYVITVKAKDEGSGETGPEEKAIVLDVESFTLEKGNHRQLTAKTTPSNATVTWTSSNEAVAAVEPYGLVIAVEKGEAVITAEIDKTTRATCTVVVEETAKPEVPEMTITAVENKPVELKVNDTASLEVKVTPQNEAVKWETSNGDIVNVSYATDSNAKATVKALKVGKAEVKASLVKDSKKFVTFSINVSESTPVEPEKPVEPETPVVTELKLEVSELLLAKGGTGTLKVTNAPENTKLEWTSADPKVASVENGTVTAVSKGKTTITVNGENCKPASAVVTVTEETGAVLEGSSEVKISVKKDAVEVSSEDLPDSVTNEELAAAKDAAVDAALNSLNGNTEVLKAAKGLKEAVKVKLLKGQRGVSSVGSELKDMEVIAEMVKGKLVVRPSRLVYDASVAMDIFDENGNLVNADRHVSNDELNGKITFRLAIPKTVKEKYAQVVHRSDDYRDSNIRNLVIQKQGTDNAYISVEVSHFSEFDITFTNSKVSSGSSGSSGGSGSSSYKAPTEGTWVKDAAGWWYKFPNHTWPANCWTQLTWNGVSQWYRFNEAGYMVTGWYLDADGNWYFLHNVSDGSQGHMYTGWHQIEGKWYYFRENVGGPAGSLVVNRATPDGYTVDANGVWIQ